MTNLYDAFHPLGLNRDGFVIAHTLERETVAVPPC